MAVSCFRFCSKKRAGKKRQERKNERTRKNIPDIKLVGGRREPRWRGALKSVKIFKRSNARTKLVHGQRGCVCHFTVDLSGAEFTAAVEHTYSENVHTYIIHIYTTQQPVSSVAAAVILSQSWTLRRRIV